MKTFIPILVFLLITSLCNSQTASQAKSSTYQANEQQWEYLVVSFGKTEFSIPEKTLAYKIVGIAIGQESTSLQSKIDILGRFGWEMVTIVGAIGGDQQIVFKRKYDKSRTANEYGLINSGKEIYLKDLQDIIERASLLEQEQKKYEEQLKNKPRLVNLDEIDEANKRTELLKNLETSYKSALSKMVIANNSVITIDYKSSYSSDINVNINVDLTDKFLINGNNYRGSEVKKFLDDILKAYRFRDNLISKYSGISIKVNGYIKFNGVPNYILSITTSQSYSDSNWTSY